MTHTTSQFELSVPLLYIETTIPSGMTIDEYRRSRPRRRSRWQTLLRDLRPLKRWATRWARRVGA
jgi:hypothetical protein